MQQDLLSATVAPQLGKRHGHLRYSVNFRVKPLFLTSDNSLLEHLFYHKHTEAEKCFPSHICDTGENSPSSRIYPFFRLFQTQQAYYSLQSTFYTYTYPNTHIPQFSIPVPVTTHTRYTWFTQQPSTPLPIVQKLETPDCLRHMKFLCICALSSSATAELFSLSLRQLLQRDFHMVLGKKQQRLHSQWTQLPAMESPLPECSAARFTARMKKHISRRGKALTATSTHIAF